MLAQHITRFCDLIGLDPGIVRQADQLDNFTIAVSLTAGQVQHVSRIEFEELSQVFGAAITLTIRRGRPLLEILEGVLPDNIDELLQRLQTLQPDSQLDFQLLINKSTLLRSLDLLSNRIRTIFFLFPERLVSILRASVVIQDTTIFLKSYHPTLIVISGYENVFSGPLLTICSEQDASHYIGIIPSTSTEMRGLLDQYYALAHTQLNWSSFHLQNITPLHYLGEWNQLSDVHIQRLLCRNLLHLFILYTANRSNKIDDRFESFYTTAEQMITLRLGDSSMDESNSELLPAFVRWLLDSQGTDRLAIFRSVVAREIDEDDPSHNYDRFSSRFRQLFSDTRWHFQVFVDGKIDRHFQELEKVADDSARISTQVSDSIDTVTKGLTDVLLATVGVVIGSFLAALIENKTQGSIFLIAMRGYAFYLGFYLLYRMGSVLHSYRLLDKEATERFGIYADRLGKERVAQIQIPMKRRQKQFWIWFIVTALVYLTLAVGVWLASTRIPQSLVNRGIIVPAATTATTTPTPIPATVTPTSALSTTTITLTPGPTSTP